MSSYSSLQTRTSATDSEAWGLPFGWILQSWWRESVQPRHPHPDLHVTEDAPDQQGDRPGFWPRTKRTLEPPIGPTHPGPLCYDSRISRFHR